MRSKFDKYAELLFQYNKKVRLTGALTLKSIRLLIEDSIKPFEMVSLKENSKCLDFGTGGGIPGIPLSIVFPKVHFFLLDSNLKKIQAVEYFTKQLNITNVICINNRIENYRDRNFDYVVSKAVSKLNILIELTADKLTYRGKLLFFKGKNAFDELMESKKIMSIMGVQLESNLNYESDKHLLIFRKIHNAKEGFPRRYKKILKYPVI